MTSLVRFLCIVAIFGAPILMPAPAASAVATSGSDNPPTETPTPAPSPTATVTTPAGSTPASAPEAATTPETATTPAPEAAPETITTPEVGSTAVNFSLTTSEGKPTKLKDYRGKWVVLYFYPKDFTPGCTIEAHNFQRDLAKYNKLNAVILGVSVDSPESHKEFCAKEKLNFKLA